MDDGVLDTLKSFMIRSFNLNSSDSYQIYHIDNENDLNNKEFEIEENEDLLEILEKSQETPGNIDTETVFFAVEVSFLFLFDTNNDRDWSDGSF